MSCYEMLDILSFAMARVAGKKVTIQSVQEGFQERIRIAFPLYWNNRTAEEEWLFVSEEDYICSLVLRKSLSENLSQNVQQYSCY